MPVLPADILSSLRGIPAVLLSDATHTLTVEDAIARVRQSSPDKAEHLTSCRQVLLDWRDALLVLAPYIGDDNAILPSDISRISSSIIDYFRLRPVAITEVNLRWEFPVYCMLDEDTAYELSYSTCVIQGAMQSPPIPHMALYPLGRRKGVGVTQGFLAYLIRMAVIDSYLIHSRSISLTTPHSVTQMLNQCWVLAHKCPIELCIPRLDLNIPLVQLFEGYLQQYAPAIKQMLMVDPQYPLSYTPYSLLLELEKKGYDEFCRSDLKYIMWHAQDYHHRFVEYLEQQIVLGITEPQSLPPSESSTPLSSVTIPVPESVEPKASLRCRYLIAGKPAEIGRTDDEVLANLRKAAAGGATKLARYMSSTEAMVYYDFHGDSRDDIVQNVCDDLGVKAIKSDSFYRACEKLRKSEKVRKYPWE